MTPTERSVRIIGSIVRYARHGAHAVAEVLRDRPPFGRHTHISWLYVGFGTNTVMRNTVRISILLLASIFGIYALWLQASSAPDERTLQMTAIAPDGSLEARVYSNVWAGALTAGSDREQTVEIVSVGQKAAPALPVDKTVTRFNMDSGTVVAILWQSTHHLVIVTSAGTRPAGFVRSVDGISSTILHYDPRRARQRACIGAFARAVAAGPVVTPPAPCAFWLVSSN